MKKMIMASAVSAVLFISGCATLDSVLIPEEGEIKSDTVKMVDAVAGGLAATGNPYAVPALAGSTLISIIAGAYTNMRKKQKLADADDKAAQTKIVTESIIQAIEEAAEIQIAGSEDTLGDVVKNKVEKKLRDNDAFLIGKAIIEAFKEAN